MFREFMSSVILKDSFKTLLTEQAMYEVAQHPDTLIVHSPVLYRLYTLFVAGREHVEERPMFFRKVGTYLYYERFNCKHGNEFYYYVRFDKASTFYKEHKDLIELLVLSNDPSTLTDYEGSKDTSIYNRTLKEKLL